MLRCAIDPAPREGPTWLRPFDGFEAAVLSILALQRADSGTVVRPATTQFLILDCGPQHGPPLPWIVSDSIVRIHYFYARKSEFCDF